MKRILNWFRVDRQPTIRNKFRTGSVATSQGEGGILIADCGVTKKKSKIRIPHSEISLAGRCAPSSDFVLTNRVAFRQGSRTGAKSETEPFPRILNVLLAAVLPLVVAHLGVNGIAAGKPQTTDPIVAIRNQYVAINQQARKYSKVKKELSGFSLEGGELTAYFDGPAIVKMVANHYGESGRAIEEYYYRDGKLIFVFRQEQRYDKPMSGKVVRTQQNRFYFQNDRLIRWLNEKGRPEAADTAEFQQQQDQYLQTSTKFLNGARSTDSTIAAE